MDLRERLRLEFPILQAGLGGGLAGADLAAAVSNAGALGTLGLVAPRELRDEIRRTRDRAPRRPLAVNLLMPFVRRAHIEVCIDERVTAVVLFFGFAPASVTRLRSAGIFVFHQVGTAVQARRAIADGADALIAQGREAGGHLLGVAPAHETLQAVIAVAEGRPVILAGGVASEVEVRAAMANGAAGVACGSRFLLTDECLAHPGYKARVLGAPRTIETRLFGFGWPARHRVVPNAATEQWCSRSAAGPIATRVVNRLSAPLARVVPMRRADGIVSLQRLAVPIYSPASARVGSDERALDVTPLYAGECVRQIRTVRPAEAVVRELAAGLSPLHEGRERGA